MSKDFKHLKPAVDKTINLGIIDNWLRGVCGMVPESVHKKQATVQEQEIDGVEVTFLDANTHTLCFGSHELIKESDIEKMVGFAQLVKTCSQSNVRLDLANMGQGNLVVDFTPEEPFTKSEVFGAKFTNVLPGVFGMKR